MTVTTITSVGLASSVKRIGRSNADRVNYGNTKGAIAGKVLEKGLPVARRVLCHQRDTGALVGSTWSNASGNYSFSGLDDSEKYYIVALDEDMSAEQYNAAVQDLIPASKAI